MVATSDNLISLSRLPQVKQRVGLSRSSIYAKIAVGEFPAPISLGGRAVAWLDSEITGWITDRLNASRAGTVQAGGTK
jgi:prophage regulatory protein